MLIEYRRKEPFIRESAIVAPTAVVCGDVTTANSAWDEFLLPTN
jgi:carbonic anhydrase/acetyltransferase-like protein (isoleucine patch superfamily)